MRNEKYATLQIIVGRKIKGVQWRKDYITWLRKTKQWTRKSAYEPKYTQLWR